jgi:hypothetical protein
VSLREPGRNLQIQSTAPLNVSGSHFRTRRAKPQRPLCPDETCMEVTALKDQAETCRHFADRTIAERGVRYGRVATTPTSAKTKRHPKAYLAIETPVVACPPDGLGAPVGEGRTGSRCRGDGPKFHQQVLRAYGRLALNCDRPVPHSTSSSTHCRLGQGEAASVRGLVCERPIRLEG